MNVHHEKTKCLLTLSACIYLTAEVNIEKYLEQVKNDINATNTKLSL